MRGRLGGRRAVITGGAAGIGAATAELFLQEGAQVLLVDQDEVALVATADRLRAAFPQQQVISHPGAVGDPELGSRLAQQAQSLLGGVDALVNNAAMRRPGLVADMSDQVWMELLNVNLVGAASITRALLPLLRDAQRSSVVNVSSCYAAVGRQGMALYDASKAGLLAFTRSVAAEEAARGVRCNAVCPGPTLTEFHKAKAAREGVSLAALQDQRKGVSIQGRWAEPREVAWPILWLTSEEGSNITGTALMVDGGLSAI